MKSIKLKPDTDICIEQKNQYNDTLLMNKIVKFYRPDFFNK